MYGPRVLLWCLGLGGLFLALVFVSVDQRALAVAGFVLVLVCPGLGEVYAQRRRRDDWFRRAYGTREEFVRSLDTDALRRLREEKGTLEAVRDLRRRHPELPLKVAAETVEQL
ncbi:hypothetical protein [Streptomyces sp. NPDC014733]|uniref:hypothetical protein n=1 Tax=Streptomyces sp. NPDC014733 TaxID=3364885 RepID=UPI0036F63385